MYHTTGFWGSITSSFLGEIVKNIPIVFATITIIVFFLSCQSDEHGSTDPILLNDSTVTPQTFESEEGEWLYNNMIHVNSIDMEDDDFSDLHAWGEIVKNKKIVLLGEQSHGDGATFHAKTRLIRYLHEVHGFNVLAFESNIYDCWKADKLFLAGVESPLMSAFQGIYPIWVSCNEFQPLVSYIADTQNSEKRLEIAGFDIKPSGFASRTHYFHDLLNILKEHNKDSSDVPNWTLFRSIIQPYFELKVKVGPSITLEESELVLETINFLIDEFEKAEATNKEKIFVRSFKNLKRYALVRLTYGYDSPRLDDARDLQMASNCSWLANTFYPDEKIIVWAATFHIIRNLEEIHEAFAGMRVMGDALYLEMGDQIYVLGFNASRGISGQWYNTPSEIRPIKEGSLEDFMDHSSLEYGILDFSVERILPSWLENKIYSNQMAYVSDYAKWIDHEDGVFYTKTMYPGTLIEFYRTK